MLLNKNKLITTNDIVLLKFINGDEVVGKVTEINIGTTDKSYTVSKPIMIVPMRQAGGVGLSFAPFIFSADEDVDIVVAEAKLLISPLKANDDIKKNYIQATTGIELPGKSSLITP